MRPKEAAKAALAAAAMIIGTVLSFSAGAIGLNGDEAYTDGPQTCIECHQVNFERWLAHGHSRQLAGGPALKPLEGKFGLFAGARDVGFLLPPHDPKTYAWNNILFVIGASKHWKTRFVGLDGKIITAGGKNQFNWQDGSWVDYHKDEAAPYSCGACHTTGFRPDGTVFNENGFAEAVDEGIPGIEGDWAHFNVTCEACHGPGAEHLVKPTPENVKKDKDPEICGRCHVRNPGSDDVVARDGFIVSRGQFPELLIGGHADLACVDCHNPHVPGAAGIKVAPGDRENCENAECHIDETTEYRTSSMYKAGVLCQDCHMGKATKSAVAVGPYQADVWTHLVGINKEADYTLFTDDGAGVNEKLSLEFACFRCHASANKEEFSKIENFHTIGRK